MKNTTKLISIMLALVLALAMAVPAFAAVTSSEVTGVAGETVDVVFTFDNIKAIGGVIEFSNDAIFSSVKVDGTGVDEENGNGGFSFVYNETAKRLAGYATKVVDSTIVVKVTLTADAKAGDTCDVTLVYESSEDGSFSVGNSYTSETVTVKVVAGETPDEIDYTELKAQIARADALEENKYTPDSWAKMKVAYDKAVAALTSQSQEDVNIAAKNLKDAIDALVEITDDPNPPTNDSSFIIWTAVVVSGLALAGAFLFTKKKTAK